MAIIKRNNGGLYTKSSIPVVKISEQEKRKFQHEFCNLAKKILKSRVDKGPDNGKVAIAENMITFTCEHFMTKYEKYVLSVDPSSIDVLKEARVKTNRSFVEDTQEIDNFIKNILGARVLGYLYDICLEEDFALWVIILDRQIEVE